MHTVIIGDTFPPMRTSGAVMLKDLADEFIAQGDTVTVIVPSDSQTVSVVEKIDGNLQVLFVKACKTKDIGYLQRTLAEFFNPFLMWARLRRFSPFLKNSVELVVWYSPSIFWGPLVKRIKGRWNCPSYLVLRDIFPDWALDLGLLTKLNPALHFFRQVANYQYHQADAIGVQSPNNLDYLVGQNSNLKNKLEVLWNWMREDNNKDSCTIRLSETVLKDKKVLVYAGNIGVAQGVDTFLKIIQAFAKHENIGFLFVGRGSEMDQLKTRVSEAKIKSVLFYPEIPSEQINDLYAQCNAGIIVLDKRHKTHNIPGKFVSYMHSGLPVFGVVNSGNDLISIVQDHGLGYLSDASKMTNLSSAADRFIRGLICDHKIHDRCKGIAGKLFSARRAVYAIKRYQS